MFSSTFTIADLNRPSPRNQRSLHGSQSHANLHFGTSNNQSTFADSVSSVGSGMGGGMGNSAMQSSMGSSGQPGFGASHHAQQPQQYMAGYLLAASQGQPPPAPSREFTLPPLDNDKSLKRGPSMYGRGFGEESLLSAPRPSPKGRSPRTPASVDDENAPPTLSISESQYSLQDPQQPRLNTRHSVGGFHPLSKSTTFTPASSMSTTYESTPQRQQGQGMDIIREQNPNGYGVTIFGFTPGDRQLAIDAFMTEGAIVPEDQEQGQPMEENDWKNWVEIVYPNQWDAARAVRKSGNVALHGGRVFVGAKWTDPANEAQFGVVPTPSMNSAMDLGSSRSRSSTIATGVAQQSPQLNSPLLGTRAVRLKSSANAFRSSTIATTTPSFVQSEAPVDEWGLAEQAKRMDATVTGRAPAPLQQDNS
ncbi:hypothetical protein FRB99_001570, partial [Tulasnella sp. 403]